MGDLFDADDAAGTAHLGTGLMGGGLPAVHQQAAVVIKAPVGTTLDSIPNPQPPAGDGDLTQEEEATFEACKAGMDNLHNAFWVAGKALETMKAGELHRKSGIPNFADFVWATWEVSESQAQRLMGEWRMGEALAALGWRPRESQVRELVDVAKQSGPKAAVSVYDVVARTGQRVTARALKEVVKRLPPIPRDASAGDVSQIVRSVIQGERSAGETGGSENSPIGESVAENGHSGTGTAESEDIRRLRKALAQLQEAAKSINRPTVQRALSSHPEAAEQLLGEIDQALDKVKRAVRRPSPE
ncbi:hypothetical protein ACFYOY_35740 [Streptomyces sp. NPDC007875]|uniref:hypothetical protein n=1 Tax=Streptomyces sp. NPDC007875 TaxID=3364783 RepID=UPI0036BED62E